MPDTVALAREERAELADFLATLTPEQWEAPTLCRGWSVRDVAAHVVSYDVQGMTGFLRTLVLAGLSPDRANQKAVDALHDMDPWGLVALLRRYTTPEGFTARFGGRIALTDGAIHHQDIRRPLGLPRTIPPERLRAILDFAMIAPPIHVAPRIRGLRLRATDLDWSHGKGAEVTGPGEALLMAAAGRADALDELDGPGQGTLAARLRA
ncbi:maleylpyruvate isomerase family mycothiol-dependent enzyme [Actinomycetospora aeridis]|uniref:Maleylpyruvate isomerase family mycothiol-dependent enzyme n=1 Tax=Actinomycetospora aeridis TaxID=3129231 RepID=A0ABU8MYR2_9PSEU